MFLKIVSVENFHTYDFLFQMFATLNVGIVYLMATKLIRSDNRTFLKIEEIGRLAKALSELGVSKIRLTGGEPTVRKDFFEIIKIIKENSGIKKTVMTTNGYRLDKIANNIKNSGLDGINISIDSLNANTFKKITGHDRLEEILKRY